ncbi:carbohydrate ABC transporter permease [Paenibacillus senegalensis]|uniref:carbohydrate ABC transporter permease n=1 Tax=Paenibacillus senegalensis TaxID=1465766 RepID=UPI000287BEC4|nr:carbohydrate ABC transporter permease [Paenibacillus senegalensis]
MKASTGDKIFYGINYAIMAIAALTCLIPLLNILALSLSDSSAIMSGRVTLFPIDIQLDSYRMLIERTKVVTAFSNSLVITVGGTVLCMVFTVLAAYPLSRKYFYARKTITLAVVFTMLFSGGLIPSYLVVKSLGLINTYWALWLPGLVSVYNMMILRTFFEGIPEELVEASRMDGCGEMRLLLQVILPLSVPVIATLTLFYGVGFWNSFQNVLIYINDSNRMNLTVMVQQMIHSQSLQETASLSREEVDRLATPEGLKAAAVMVLVIPMLVVYPFIQKYFVKGIMIGSIKG